MTSFSQFSAMFQGIWHRKSTCLAALLPLFVPVSAAAQAPVTQNVVQSYADLVGLTESSPLVIFAELKKLIPIPLPKDASPFTKVQRAYFEAQGIDLLSGSGSVSASMRYLADVPLDSRGKMPNPKKQMVLLFARPTPETLGKGGPQGGDDIQLVSPDAQLPWSKPLESEIRKILNDLAAPDSPPHITGINMALYQQGDLAGEGETQIFLTTAKGTPAAIIIQHKPGQSAHWAASFSEVVDAAKAPPAPETLEWYRLACSLPETLPSAANLGETQDAKDQAVADYALVRRDLGPCTRTRVSWGGDIAKPTK